MRAFGIMAMAIGLTFWQGSTAPGPAPDAMAAEMPIEAYHNVDEKPAATSGSTSR
jgi:hypothetical protein